MKFYLPDHKEIAAAAINLLADNNHQIELELKQPIDATIDGVFVRTYTKVDKKFLSQLPNLKFVLRAGVGLDTIDLLECEKRKIKVVNSPGSNALSVAEHSLGMILMLLKNIKTNEANMRQGTWRQRSLMGQELSEKTIGLVGCGAVGQQLAGLLKPFNVKILGYDKYTNSDLLKSKSIFSVELNDLLTSSDVISIQVPLTPETRDMIGFRELSLMKPTSFLINVSRGEILSELALIEALEKGTIAGAALDVVRNEPNPDIRLCKAPNLILTPHIASWTQEADITISTQTVENFLKLTK